MVLATDCSISPVFTAYGRIADDALLRARELGARDHLHGARDLLRRLGARDALADRLEGGHRLTPLRRLPLPWSSSSSWLLRGHLVLVLLCAIALAEGLAERLERGGERRLDVLVDRLLGADVFEDLRVLAVDVREQVVLVLGDLVDGRCRRGNPCVPAKIEITCFSTVSGWYWGCLRSSTRRAPRSSCLRVTASRSLAN